MTKESNFKKVFAFVLVIALLCVAFAAFALQGRNPSAEVVAAEDSVTVTMQIGNPMMTVGGVQQEIDPGRGTVPILAEEGRTLLPVRAMIEAVGGSVAWDEGTQTAALTYSSDVIRLIIDSTTAYLNDVPQTLDVSPVVMNDRTMLPIRFIAESFKFTVDWNDDTQTVTIIVPADKAVTDSTATPTSTTEGQTADAPVVYMTTEITPESLVKIYEQLGFNAEGNVAVKMSTGEPPNSNY